MEVLKRYTTSNKSREGFSLKFQVDRTDEKLLYNFSYRDLVATDSDVWLYIDLFKELDLSDFENVYSGEGQVPIDPMLMLRTIFYGLTHGIIAGRKLKAACRNDNRYIVLSGDRRPDNTTFKRFVIRQSKNIERIFVKLVQIAQRMGLVKLGRIAIDGSRFKANAGINKSMKYEKMDRAIKHIKEDLKKLHQDLEKENSEEENVNDKLDKEILEKEQRIEKIKKAKKKIEEEYEQRKNKSRKKIGDYRKSFNDLDAQSLSHKSCSKGHMFGYNVQAAVDETNQIIIAAEIHDKATDYEALPELIEVIEENYDEKPEEVLADTGYKSVNNLEVLEEKEISPYIAVGSKTYNDIEPQFTEQIKATSEKHIYTCMSGKKLQLFARRSDGRTEFKITKEFCKDCPYTAECKAFGKKTISIMKEEDRQRINRLLERSRTEKFKEVYKRRKAIVEGIFGNIKNKGIKILVTGVEKVNVWWKMACTAHNIEKIVKYMALNKA
jgi:transposase